ATIAGMEEFDVAILGGGHAGVEAAHAAARLGARCVLITLHPSTIAQMSCNPAIGGVGKGQIVREIDALGGLMGQAADATGIQFRMLNRSKGPAVWGPRCQSDRYAYAAWMQRALAELETLTILAGEAIELLTEGGCVKGVRVRPTDDLPDALQAAEGAALDDELARSLAAEQTARSGETFDVACRSAVVTAGTFLGGVLHVGERSWAAGRYGEEASGGLGESLTALGHQPGRMKTGTCPRIDGRTIDYDQCTRQDGDADPAPFSFLHDELAVEQIPCWLSATTPEIHRAIRENLHRAPLYTGQIRSTGPRYCPSIETKLEKFPDKDTHQVFIEPEGRDTHWVYVNGISTSLPIDVQEFVVRHIPGLQDAEVLRWGYAIEYDYVPPTRLTPTLESKHVGGLFIAGQLTGTTGYEEAAGQGLLAGVNAVRSLRDQPGVVLGRDEAYIGVMIDDLVTKDVVEPYRMFTSRAEHRLSLRADNADRRLTPLGEEIGLVGRPRAERFAAKWRAAEGVERILRETRHAGKTLWERMQQPEMTLEKVAELAGERRGELAALMAEHPQAAWSVGIDARYAGYIEKARASQEAMGQLSDRAIPPDFAYEAVSHLRIEAKQRLAAIQPRTLGQALRISGITPADVTVLAIHLARVGG
ncbi:MAG: tRNA uridine-5-carboxymethylaminomethyl(34) synthesis enzyme MnmG, partial [Phycisphaerae bacterium]